MTHLESQPTTLPPRWPSPLALGNRPLFALIATLLLLSFALQWPTHQAADWQLFAFYDPGTTLKGDFLLDKGYVPTVDFGYTHGLIPLVYARAGFALLGRTPWAFLTLTLLTELVMAHALARIARATGIASRWSTFLLLLVGLPMAIMPAYLTLTHPLEAMLILLALAAQAEGRRPQALALMTVCLFTKPSMAYVYGLLLLLLILYQHRRHLSRIPLDLLPAALAGLTVASLLWTRFGLIPVLRTLLPLTGAKTYATTDFGFFHSGLNFWYHIPPWHYLGAPAGIFLVALLAGFVGLALAFRAWRRGAPSADTADTSIQNARTWELLATLTLLHSAFLLGFYGWTGSWTYYSYMPVLILCLLATQLHKKPLTLTLITWMLLSHTLLGIFIYDAWTAKTPRSANRNEPAALPGLWRYPTVAADWSDALRYLSNQPTLILTNGYLPNLPPNLHMPDAWFPQPGIPTETEIARIKTQVSQSHYLVLWWEYRTFDLWNTPDFVPFHAQFTKVHETPNHCFTVLERLPAP